MTVLATVLGLSLGVLVVVSGISASPFGFPSRRDGTDGTSTPGPPALPLLAAALLRREIRARLE